LDKNQIKPVSTQKMPLSGETQSDVSIKFIKIALKRNHNKKRVVK